MKKWLISVFDYTGNNSRPYREDSNWDVLQIDIQHGFDFLSFDFHKWYESVSEYGTYPEVGIIAAVPCTHDAVSGAKHFVRKDADGTSNETTVLMDHLKAMIFYFKDRRTLRFWQIENPKTRLHNRFPWIKPIRQKFNPTDFAGYDPIPDNSRYNKETWLFGEFNLMIPKPMEPLIKENPGWKKYGGKRLKTKNLRSVSPLGYCYAFHAANN